MLKKISVFFAAFLFFTNAFSQQNVISINYIDELAKIGEDEISPFLAITSFYVTWILMTPILTKTPTYLLLIQPGLAGWVSQVLIRHILIIFILVEPLMVITIL